MTEIFSPKDIDPDYKYLIIEFEKTTVHHEADERSKTNPGHGYPEHNEEFKSFRMYGIIDENDLRIALTQLFLNDQHRKDILVIEIGKIIPIGVSLKIDLG